MKSHVGLAQDLGRREWRRLRGPGCGPSGGLGHDLAGRGPIADQGPAAEPKMIVDMREGARLREESGMPDTIRRTIEKWIGNREQRMAVRSKHAIAGDHQVVCGWLSLLGENPVHRHVAEPSLEEAVVGAGARLVV